MRQVTGNPTRFDQRKRLRRSSSLVTSSITTCSSFGESLVLAPTKVSNAPLL
ncbi:hypothetical protein Hanom_Chr13g01183791 [Helianthus anomalus]